ncbi:MAG: c-type cytochrome [Blastocatellia bacterium]|nr:c-type cytochrome [Blastocatellia bacterium]
MRVSKSMEWRRAMLAGVAAAALLFGGGSGAGQEPTREQTIAAGRRVFSGSCGMAYCHGNDAVGGGGPKLRGREFSAETLTRVINEGVPGTGMPAFKSNLKKEQVAQVVAYLLSVNKELPGAKPAAKVDPHFGGGAAPGPAEKLKAAEATRSVSAKPWTDAPAVSGDWQAGEQLFFDAADLGNCRVCHTVNGRGGAVASDLSRLSEKPPREILQRILAPQASLDGKYGMVALTLKNGERVAGILRDENAAGLRVYDTATLPPISRHYLKTEIAETRKLDASGCPGNYAAKFTLKQLLDMIAFLKTSDPAKPAVVSLRDLF